MDRLWGMLPTCPFELLPTHVSCLCSSRESRRSLLECQQVASTTSSAVAGGALSHEVGTGECGKLDDLCSRTLLAPLNIVNSAAAAPARAVGDQARRDGRLDDARVGELITNVRGMRGIARARQALGYCDPRRESPLESGSAAHFHLWGFPQPELQAEFFDSRGFVARTDFDWAAFDLVGEADGRVKYAGTAQEIRNVVRAEKWREARLRGLGKVVVRWGWIDVAGDGFGLRSLLSPFFDL